MESLVLLPIMAFSMPSGMPVIPQIVLSQKENIQIQTLKAQAEAIDAYFDARNMPLAGTGMKMAEEAEKNSIDWRLLPAIAVRESTGGKAACKKARHNFFGWGSCKISFDSDEHAIERVALNLGGNNPNTEHYYSGKTTKEILKKYNPPSIVPRYAEQVLSIMNAIGAEDFAIQDELKSSSDLLAQKV